MTHIYLVFYFALSCTDNDQLKVTFAPNLAKKISTNFYYLSLLFQLSVAYSENFKEIKALEVLKFLKADGVYVMPSLYFVRKFYNLRTYAALPF